MRLHTIRIAAGGAPPHAVRGAKDTSLGRGAIRESLVNDDGDVGSVFALAAERAASGARDLGMRSAAFVLACTGDAAERASVRYRIRTGDGQVANSDIDGGKLTGRVEFEADEAERKLTLGVSGDAPAERNDRPVLQLTTTRGGVPSEDTRAQSLIRDDDSRGDVLFG